MQQAALDKERYQREMKAYQERAMAQEQTNNSNNNDSAIESNNDKNDTRVNKKTARMTRVKKDDSNSNDTRVKTERVTGQKNKNTR